MTVINRKSSVLIMITICLLVLLSSGGIYTMYLTYTIKPDAEIINRLGVIRGSVQRLVKLELSEAENDELKDFIDVAITDFNENKIAIFDHREEIQNSLKDLSLSWEQLKEARVIYRNNPTIENQQVLIIKSEDFWEKSNDTVFVSQLVTERKLEKYQTSFIFFLMNFVLGVFIVYLIKKYVKDTLESQANFDGLTKVYNRRYFNEYFEIELQKSERYQRRISFIIYDIDHFKRVNDTYGHDVGDGVLKELCQLILANIRKSDMLSRLGGEEFGILAPEIGAEEAFLLSEKLRKIVEKHTFMHVGNITISLGVTQYIQGDDTDSLYKRADVALYKSKNNGRNRSEIE